MSSDEQFNTVHLQQNLGRLAVKGGSVLIIGQAIQFLLSTTSTIVLARLLVPQDFGLVAMVAPFVGFIAFLRDCGLHMATIQQETINHKQISTLFWFNLGMGFILMVLLGLLSPAIARFFGRDELLLITSAYAINMVISAASIQHSALLARQMAFKKIRTAGIASQIAGIVAAVLSAWYGLGYWALIVMAMTTTVSHTILIWSFSGWMPGLPQRGAGVRKMLAFGGGLTINSLIYQASQYIDNILIARMLGASSIGYYDRAKQLFAMPLMQLMGPASNVSIPALSRLSGEPDRYSRAYLRIQEKLLIPTAFFSAFLVVYGDWVIRVLLGPQWAIAGPILQALAIGGIITPVSSSLSWLLVTQGRSRDLAYWSPFSFLFACAAIICGYRWGILGIAVSISTFQYLGFILFCLWVGRKGPVATIEVLKNMAPVLIAAALTCVWGFPFKLVLTDSSPALSLMFGAMICGLLFFIVLWLIPRGRSSLLDMLSTVRLIMSKDSHCVVDQGGSLDGRC